VPKAAESVSLAIECSLATFGHVLVAGVDEVGRGAIAGPVSVGVVVIDTSLTDNQPPQGLADSKALSPKRREALVQPIYQWASAAAVGHASAAEIDELGIISALGLAGRRGLIDVIAQLSVMGYTPPSAVLLDGNLDWLARGDREVSLDLPEVRLVIGGDRISATVAAASVIAKVERDAFMVALDESHPQYGWAGNKGYASQSHRESLRAHGLSDFHRKSWHLGV